MAPLSRCLSVLPVQGMPFPYEMDDCDKQMSRVTLCHSACGGELLIGGGRLLNLTHSKVNSVAWLLLTSGLGVGVGGVGGLVDDGRTCNSVVFGEFAGCWRKTKLGSGFCLLKRTDGYYGKNAALVRSQ